jgi:2-methylisocitrate lyase-like PEP mutase family enzyme
VSPPIGLGAHNPVTALLAERAGFDLVWLGSLEMSASLGLPDINLVTAPEIAAQVSAIKAVCGLPVYVDADNGYGSNETAVRAASLFEAAGAAAICIEDNAFPKRNSLYDSAGARSLEAADTFAARVEAVKARTSLTVIARTEALVAGLGITEAVRRLELYAQAGADAVFAQANRASRDQLIPVIRAIAPKHRMVLAPTTLPEVSAAEFAAFGDVTVIFANVVIRGLTGLLPGLLNKLLASGRLADILGDLADLDELFELTSTAAWLRGPADVVG